MDSTIKNTAFQEALQRARQLAAKVAQPGSKRPNEDDDFGGHESKRTSYGDEIGSQLSSIKNQSRPQKNQLYLDGIISNGEKTLDFMIPGKKVGFVIGKGGEMIRQLQDKAGVKMVIFQDTSQTSEQEKQLRITGPPEKVDYAKQLVKDLLQDKDMESASRMRRGGDTRMNPSGMNEYGSSSRITFFEYPVSPQLIGLVIGKGGETIRKIQADSGCRVQFDSQKLDAQGNKICQFTGTQDAVNKAVELVKEIVDTFTGGGGPGGVEEIRLAVPASRTGTVIGRGGETIRQLKQQSGCNIELDKNYLSDNDEKCFIIRGAADKISYAQQLVSDKVGGQASVISSTLPQYNDNPYAYLTGQMTAASSNDPYGGGAAAWAQQQQPVDANKALSTQEQYAMWNAYYAQYYSQQQPQVAANGAGGQEQHLQQQTQGHDGQQQQQQQYDEAVYQQWIEYYKACGMTKEAEAMEKTLREYKNSKKNGEQVKNGNSSSGDSS